MGGKLLRKALFIYKLDITFTDHSIFNGIEELGDEKP
jgi:hypothetical protein